MAVVGVLESHTENIVGVELSFERDVTQGGVKGVLRRVEQTGRLHLLIVASALDSESAKRFERLGDGVDGACPRVFGLDYVKQVV